MARTYLEDTPEEGLHLAVVPADLDDAGLTNLDYRILELDLSGCRPPRILSLLREVTGISLATIYGRQKRPAYVAVVERVRASHMERIARGEFGAIGIAKANLVANMRRMQGMATHAENEAVKFKALEKMIALSGFQPPAPVVVEHPERIIESMTPEEVEHFAKTGEFPPHLADQMMRVSSAVLRRKDATGWKAAIEDAAEDEDPRVPLPRAEPAEVEAEEGPL